MKTKTCVLMLIILVLTLVDISDAALTDGLVGYWPLDALSGSDASGNGLDGTVVGDPEVTADRFGNDQGAMRFFGIATDYVDLGDGDELQITGAMTLAAWVILDSSNTNNGRIIAKSGAGGRRSWSLNIESGNSDPTFQIAVDGAVNLSVSDVDPLPQDEWAHMTGVYRPGQRTEIHVNGALKEVYDIDIPEEQFSGNGLSALIGSRNQCGNCGWVGSIDDVAIWDRDLSEAEVLQLFQTGIDIGGLPGDFNGNGALDVADIDELSNAVRINSTDLKYDVNSSGGVNSDDRAHWVNELKRTWFGDANLDNQFNSGDFVVVFQAGQYEDRTPGNSGWATGDWNGDGDFDSGDFVLAFQSGGYEQGPRLAATAVPEPASGLLTTLATIGTFLLAAERRNSTPPLTV